MHDMTDRQLEQEVIDTESELVNALVVVRQVQDHLDKLRAEITKREVSKQWQGYYRRGKTRL